MTKFLSTRFSIVKRSHGASAIGKSSYISREKIYSEYDGKHYHESAEEDLVHSEVSLCANAPEEYRDREKLWNAVELVEKSKKAQLARMMKASLPNDWTYEVAEEVVRKYIMDNFVSKGMCVDWAIHDGVNEAGQRNLHFHALMTMRAIDEDGKWMPKQRKIYILDENGNKIRKGKNYKCKTENVTDWAELKWGKIWRKNLSDLINETNTALGLDEQWEHRSFKELGLNAEPTIHLGAKASALEKKGIKTERGNINRKVMELRGLIDSVAVISASIENFKAKASEFKNEIVDLIEAVAKRHNILQLPIISGKYLRKVSHREKLQDPENMIGFAESKGITSFSSLQGYLDEHEARYDELTDMLSKGNDSAQIQEELRTEIKDLAYAEVLDYNRKNEARERENDRHVIKDRKHSYRDR